MLLIRMNNSVDGLGEPGKQARHNVRLLQGCIRVCD